MLLEHAPTEYIDASDIRFAYGWLGPREGTPLLLLQHFTGTMDSWDPAVVNPLAEHRSVIVFDNTGVGRSSGKTPDNVDRMTTDAKRFIDALGIAKVDLLGYSLGGFIAQTLAARKRDLVRKIVLVATAPQGGEEHLQCSRKPDRTRRLLIRACPFSLPLQRRARRQAARFSSVQAFGPPTGIRRAVTLLATRRRRH